MPFQFRRLIRMALRSISISKTRGTDAQLTPKRLIVMLCMVPFYIINTTFNWICLLLDEVIFPDYRKQKIEKPLFIIGTPRTGTTLLHRIVANDKQFTSTRMWELFFAPSIIQKKFWLAVGKLDAILGGPVEKIILAAENRTFGEFNKKHEVSFFKAEEDDPILVNVFSSAFLCMYMPFFDEIEPLVYFDEKITASERIEVMTFYRECAMRHLYVFGRDKHFIAKNPSFSPKIETLNEIFPDSRFIYTVRNPLEAVPSAMSLLTSLMEAFCSLSDDPQRNDYFLELIYHWYHYPLEKFKSMPEDRCMIMEYGALVSSPMDSILSCYKRLGYEISDETRHFLKEEQDKARKYKSRHVYDYETYGITAEQIASEYSDIMKRFGYKTGSSA